jgi:hypothetical protein
LSTRQSSRHLTAPLYRITAGRSGDAVQMPRNSPLPHSRVCRNTFMADRPSKISVVRRRLDTVNAQIAAHPLRSDQFVLARAVVARTQSAGDEAVKSALREQALPAPRVQMRMMALGLASLARLNRRRIRLERQVAQLDRDSSD